MFWESFTLSKLLLPVNKPYRRGALSSLLSFKLIVLSFLLLSACTTNPRNRMEWFNGFGFELSEQETLINPDPLLLETFRGLTAHHESQLPLFRIIESEQYRIYLAIPFDTQFDQLKNQAFKDSTIIIKDTPQAYHCIERNNQHVISELAGVVEGNLYFALIDFTNHPDSALQLAKQMNSTYFGF